MPRLHPLSLLTIPFSIAGCHATPPLEVPEYPERARPPAQAQAQWADGLQAVVLSCGITELDNGVDDNCDGHIDEGHGGIPGTLEMALTWQGPSQVTLSTEPSLGTATAVTCTEGASCVARLSSQTWSGEDPLSIRVQASSADGPVRVSLSLTALGQPLGTYNVLVAAGETRDLARVATR